LFFSISFLTRSPYDLSLKPPNLPVIALRTGDFPFSTLSLKVKVEKFWMESFKGRNFERVGR